MFSFLNQQHLFAFLIEAIRLCALLFLITTIFVPLERLFALHPRKMLCKASAADIGFFFISGLVPALLLSAPLSLVAAGAHHIVPSGVHAAVAAWPLWLRALAAMVVGDIGCYWGHRWTHAIPLLWRFHAVHHAPERLYFLISSRAHPVDNAFIRLCGLTPVYILGLAGPRSAASSVVPMLMMLAFTMWGFLIHANLRWRFGPVEWLVATPAFHHWHHANDGPAAVNKNFAAMFPWIDLLFGSFHLPRAGRPARYGISSPLAKGLLAQLIEPLITGEPGPSLPASPAPPRSRHTANGAAWAAEGFGARSSAAPTQITPSRRKAANSSGA